ncbi:hypothetical protein AGABI2DRAFT_145641 [Agaricus bisporus var. bisporus H97]|uniref:hypothetical protein n=1 Tax=Agaricus bisporus var. bisporus (strain H97 / ATCC MYA-4626 / FGSC 10389) TaxID=936046 RepID=UPI00029F530A|nr:hypothetical protein AGABI2DRAFT_145641 [Agaricus bisporus var. bisporus H97]EKV44256.1 hypothetical protein AGABI2DRAFT_145641 [Agaricus bisporus var. bisporus H97]
MSEATENLIQHLKGAPQTILSVLETFQVTRSFVAGIGDYIRSTRLTDEWYGFLDRYAILMWESRDICTDSRFQLIKLNGVLKFAKQDNPNMAVIKAKVTDYSNTPFKTNEKAQTLLINLKKLDEDIQEWKVNLSDVLETKIPKQDDGSSSYRMLMKALKDLKERLPPEYDFPKIPSTN